MKTKEEIYHENRGLFFQCLKKPNQFQLDFIASIQLDALKSVRKELENHPAVDIFYGYLTREIANLKAGQK